jgi:hypothetical protein
VVQKRKRGTKRADIHDWALPFFVTLVCIAFVAAIVFW